ncbi:MAG: hypothetical protein H5T61_07130 [Thermoflexales bacterium]|nr:hypothetical protein [Thermoflexales bacterium]
MSILRDLALILLAIEAALGALAGVALGVAINYGLYRSRWWRVLPRWFLQARRTLVLAQHGVERVCRRMAAPVFAASAARAALAGMLSRRRGE